ncbi:uncharacterized protein VTP21DRAFT_7684 [Calcarisporiella thermophila]|uniref:uncharacterized protein n=1 Tax=Calcarisporiella thermophila TaxID=911321 RepID=UPI003742074A
MNEVEIARRKRRYERKKIYRAKARERFLAEKQRELEQLPEEERIRKIKNSDKCRRYYIRKNKMTEEQRLAEIATLNESEQLRLLKIRETKRRQREERNRMTPEERHEHDQRMLKIRQLKEEDRRLRKMQRLKRIEALPPAQREKMQRTLERQNQLRLRRQKLLAVARQRNESSGEGPAREMRGENTSGYEGEGQSGRRKIRSKPTPQLEATTNKIRRRTSVEFQQTTQLPTWRRIIRTRVPSIRWCIQHTRDYGIIFHEESQTLHHSRSSNCLSDSIVEGVYWTAIEKEQFFEALGRFGKRNLRAIAKSVPTKNDIQVELYLRWLQKLSKGFEPIPLSDIPAAREVSDAWLEFENRESEHLSALLEHHELKNDPVEEINPAPLNQKYFDLIKLRRLKSFSEIFYVQRPSTQFFKDNVIYFGAILHDWLYDVLGYAIFLAEERRRRFPPSSVRVDTNSSDEEDISDSNAPLKEGSEYGSEWEGILGSEEEEDVAISTQNTCSESTSPPALANSTDAMNISSGENGQGSQHRQGFKLMDADEVGKYEHLIELSDVTAAISRHERKSLSLKEYFREMPTRLNRPFIRRDGYITCGPWARFSEEKSQWSIENTNINAEIGKHKRKRNLHEERRESDNEMEINGIAMGSTEEDDSEDSEHEERKRRRAENESSSDTDGVMEEGDDEKEDDLSVYHDNSGATIGKDLWRELGFQQVPEFEIEGYEYYEDSGEDVETKRQNLWHIRKRRAIDEWRLTRNIDMLDFWRDVCAEQKLWRRVNISLSPQFIRFWRLTNIPRREQRKRILGKPRKILPEKGGDLPEVIEIHDTNNYEAMRDEWMDRDWEDEWDAGESLSVNDYESVDNATTS